MTNSSDDKLHTMVSCEWCKGTGIDETGTVDMKCYHCNGTGVRVCID